MIKDEPYELQVGDVIVSKTALGTNEHTIHRVTKKYAFVRHNDIAEGKFPRVFGFGFEPIPYRKWNMTTYTIKRNNQ